MPKVKTQIKGKSETKLARATSEAIPIEEKYRTPILLFIILLLLLVFFRDGIFGGKVFSSADNLASASFNTFLEDASKAGIYAQWVPYIFSGMPSFAALVPHQERTYDIAYAIYMYARNAIYLIGGNTSVWHVVFFYVVFAFGIYFYANYRFRDRLIAFYCSLAAVFMTPVIQLIIVGHNSKMIAIMSFPYVLLCIDKIYDYFANKETEKRRIFYPLLIFCALVFSLHVQMSSNHIQMLYYFFLASGFYLLYRLIYNFIKKTDVPASLKTLGIFIVCVIISALMYSDSYLSVREYNKYSIRGQPAITASAESKAKTEPLDYEYATNWSFSPAEVLTFFIPYWAGFGDVEYKGQRMNTYWGQMPFTTSPMYFGVITLLLGLIGIYYNFRKNVLVQALTVISFLALIISFGRTFPVLYDLFYYYAPFFSSFRAPVMIHILINVSFAILAGYGIKSIFEIGRDRISSQKFLSSAKYMFSILAFPVLISVIGFDSFYESQVMSSPLAEKISQQGANPQQIRQYLEQVSEIAYSNVKSEMLVIGLLLLASYGLCYLYVKGSLKYLYMVAGLVLLMITDLWHIDLKTLHWDNKTDMETYLKTPDWAEWILKNDPETYRYRVLNLQNGQPVRENTLAYWRLQNLYGYQGAKMRIYQDFDDVVNISNPNAWDITNVKYIISNEAYSDTALTQVFKGSKYVFLNKNYKPKAFFVKEVRTSDGLGILNSIKNREVNLSETAFTEKPLPVSINPPDSTVKAEIISYGIHNITIEVNASGNNFLFISETFYPPGWKAYIDGNETEIFKTNYLYRGIIVPQGKHKIELKYESSTYETGRMITLGTNVFMLIVFLGSALLWLIKRKESSVNN
ncbi:MAG: YfhO family protein [Ignavibacteria bacterium]|nr:YfhO family protein [Ignavibacteria bacterium]